jgi:hypothetical protein
MDISEAVKEFHKMKRGNYAVSDSDDGWIGNAIGNTSSSLLSAINNRHATVGNSRQGEANRIGNSAIHDRQTTGSMREEDCVQGEPIQRRLLQQEVRSTWSMAITVGKTQLVIAETNTRSTQVCATSL